MLLSRNSCFVKTSGRLFPILWPFQNVLTLTSQQVGRYFFSNICCLLRKSYIIMIMCKNMIGTLKWLWPHCTYSTTMIGKSSATFSLVVPHAISKWPTGSKQLAEPQDKQKVIHKPHGRQWRYLTLKSIWQKTCCFYH